MCEAKVYVTGDPTGKPVMEEVILLQPEGDGYRLTGLLGEQKWVRGQIERIDFLRHTVYLTVPEES
ncbi:MAG: CooT family nickel-binding protein [Anaerolineae bacterium]